MTAAAHGRRIRTIPDRRDVEQKVLQHRKEAFPTIARAIAAYLYEYCGQLGQ